MHSGIEKVKIFHQVTGTTKFEIKWISKASAVRSLQKSCSNIVSKQEDNRRLGYFKVELEPVLEMNKKKGVTEYVFFTFPPSERNIEKYKQDLVEEEEARNEAIKEAIKEGKEVEEEDESETEWIRGVDENRCEHGEC